jgi:hypothetical protein
VVRTTVSRRRWAAGNQAWHASSGQRLPQDGAGRPAASGERKVSAGRLTALRPFQARPFRSPCSSVAAVSQTKASSSRAPCRIALRRPFLPARPSSTTGHVPEMPGRLPCA